MSENDQENQKSEKVEEPEVKKTGNEEEKAKTKFTFKCTRCDECCIARGPIPITFWDLELWAKNGVVANFMPYLDIYQKPDGGIDLVLKPLPPPPKEGEEETTKDPFGSVPIEDLLNVKCPLYNKDDKKCLIYDNRPLSCRTYPLEFDGKNFIVVDADCPGIGESGMTKEELVKMRETARTMHYELTRMRIALPVLNQVVSNNFMRMLMKQQMDAMSNMSDEDRGKIDDILKKQEPEPESDHEHEDEDEHEHEH
ncbi:MAG: YkgJ family cysteine cluster protein [Candidatus Lokiarchaeota archaeon]|nr:YkgJ family cysteine cluster protein [Candidatus Lokiarchaeota archaeon]